MPAQERIITKLEKVLVGTAIIGFAALIAAAVIAVAMGLALLARALGA